MRLAIHPTFNQERTLKRTGPWVYLIRQFYILIVFDHFRGSDDNAMLRLIVLDLFTMSAHGLHDYVRTVSGHVTYNVYSKSS